PEVDVVALPCPDAGEVLPAGAVLGPWVTLEVEVDVTLVGLGQQLQAAPRLRREEDELRRALLPLGELQSGLLVEPLPRGASRARERGIDLLAGRRRQRLEGRDAGVDEPSTMVHAH